MTKVYCYPVFSKGKSLEICQAFAQGCGGEVVTDGVPRPGPSFFYGIDQVSNLRAWRQKGDYYYADNSSFDQCREKYFRISKNRMQPSGTEATTCERFDRLGIEIKPWRGPNENGYVLLCPQSDFFMEFVVAYKGSWTDDATQAMHYIPRPVRTRTWCRNKKLLSESLLADLKNTHTLVTWSSAAANTALLNGVPTYAMSPDSSAAYFNDSAPSTAHRREWAGALADYEFTLDEIRQGVAWKWLNRNTAGSQYPEDKPVIAP